MNTEPQQEGGRVFWVIVLVAFLVGLFLRLYLLQDQVLLDDEWHSMSFVVGKPLASILSHFAVPGGFTSIPLNLYQWALLKSVGWSEWMLRLPSVVLGLLCILFGPLLAKSLVGPRRAATFALLMAISPLLIFYGRLCRPYSAVACFTFISLLFAARWMRSGALRHAAGFAILGVLAVYTHPFAAVMVGTVAAFAFLFSVLKRMGVPMAAEIRPSWPQVLAVSVGMGLAGAALLLPAVIDSLHASFFDVAQQGTIYAASWLRLASLISGTANPVFIAMFWVALIAGAVALCRRNPWLGCTLVALYPIDMLVLLVTRPLTCHSGIVLARYSIPLVPVSLLLVASGIQSALDAVAARMSLKPSLQTVLSLAFVGALAFAGPLPGNYIAPNNFTNHGVFEHRYDPIDWSVSFASEFAPPDYPYVTTIRVEEVSPFYGSLRKNESSRPIVEYPMMIGDHFNPLYYYQRFHRRPVIVGYVWDPAAPEKLIWGGVYGNTHIDEVLNLVKDPSLLRFRNLIRMDDIEGMRARGVEYIILHKRFEAQLPLVAQPPAAMPALLEQFRRTLHPVYEDSTIAVFGLDS